MTPTAATAPTLPYDPARYKRFSGDVYFAKCRRCGGSGACGPVVIFQGRCFECHGEGVTGQPMNLDEVIAREARLARNRQRAEQRRLERVAREVAEGDARWDAFAAERPEVAEWAMTSPSEFAGSLINKVRKGWEVSDRMIAAAERAVAQRNADALVAVSGIECPEGKMTVVGEVVSTRWHHGAYGDTLKMVVRHADGWKVWGSVPTALAGIEVGQQVTFEATITQSDSDEAFGFFKRPRNARTI